MKIPSISKRIWLVMSTVMITGAFFAYYFLVYMENRQTELESKKFRTLNQYAESMKIGFFELTKKDSKQYGSIDCIPEINLDSARREIIEPIVKESEFSEMLFEVDSKIKESTFTNTISENIVDSILKKDNAEVVRQVEFKINNKDYIIFIHEFDLHTNRWRIFGFCEKKQFLGQIRSVDLIYGVTAALVLILLLLMMPLLKLWVMNELEKLRTVNVWFCGFSLVVGSSFLLVITLMANDFFTSYNSFSKTEKGDVKYRNERILELSDSIEHRFAKELRLIYNQIQKSKTLYSSLKKVANPDSAKLLYGNALDSPLFRDSPYPYFNEILWIKKDGFQDLTVATHKLEMKDVVNLGQRKYFSEALDDNTWLLPDAQSDSERFVIQSIHSYISNQHEAGFGTPIKKRDTIKSVLAIATKLQSIMDPLLPPGYQFAFIDREGKVWFHSTIDKNLSENFFDETEWDKRLLAAVNGRVATSLDVKYNRSKHRAYVRPIKNLDLYLVVLHDNEYFNTPIVLTVGLASFLIFLMFLFQGIHQIILVVTTYRFSLLKINRFFLAWLRPQRDKFKLYRKAVIVQLILLVPLGIIVARYHPILLVVCFFTLPIYLTIYHYFSLERIRIQQEQAEQNKIFFLHPFLMTSVLLALFINFFGYYYFSNENIGIVIGLQALIISILIGAYLLKPSKVLEKFFVRNRMMLFVGVIGVIKYWWLILSKATDRQLQRWHRSVVRPRQERFQNWYYAFLFLWLILASSLPTYYFYKIGYYEEGHVWLRYLQLKASQDRERREAYLDSELRENFSEQISEMKRMGDYQMKRSALVTNEVFQKSVKGDSDTINVRLSKGSTQFYRLRKSNFHDILFKGAPVLSGLAEQSRVAVYPYTGDHQWSWYEKDFSSLLKYTTGSGKIKYYVSSLVPYRLFKGDYWLLLLVIMVLSALVLYRTLRFCIIHIFGLGLLSASKYEIPVLSQGARYFIVGLPRSGKSKLIDIIRKKNQIDKIRVKYVDLGLDRVPEITENCRLIIATNFHLDLNNHENNQQKLEKLELFKKYRNVPVIIVSNLEPSTVLEFYDKLASYYNKEKGDYEIDGNYRKCKQAFRKWKNILSAYSIHYHALKTERHFSDKLIKYELNHGEYLPELVHHLKQKISSTREREEMILQVEELSVLYYQAIWNSLSCAEKFLLYDLAKDRFVNMRNMKIIRALRQKGLLVMRNSLYIMNKSFNNFILSVVVEDDEMKMEEEMRKKGSWNTLHLILVIAMVSIVVFLGIAQQELFKNFQAILGVTAALLPLLARFGGIFTGAKEKD